MNATIARRDVEGFRVAIARRLGLHFDQTRLGFLGEVLQRRLARAGVSADEYLRDLETGAATAEPSVLAQELTVGETYFFRNSEQFRAVAEIALPECRRAQAASRRLRVGRGAVFDRDLVA